MPPDLLRSWQPSEALMQDLAGNAMSLPVVMTVLQAAFTAVTWASGAAVGTAADAPISSQQDLAVCTDASCVRSRSTHVT